MNGKSTRVGEENKKTKEEQIYCCQSDHQRTNKKDSKIDSLTGEQKLHERLFNSQAVVDISICPMLFFFLICISGAIRSTDVHLSKTLLTAGESQISKSGWTGFKHLVGNCG